VITVADFHGHPDVSGVLEGSLDLALELLARDATRLTTRAARGGRRGLGRDGARQRSDEQPNGDEAEGTASDSAGHTAP
jgi:hypothetical protein